MKQSSLRFKSALRYCKTNEDVMRSNAFAKSLMDKNLNSFWRGITNVNNAKIPLASTVENCVDEPSICNMWKTHYDSLLNSVRSCEQKSEVASKITNVSEFTRKFSIASITSSFRLLKSGKASGVDGLAVEHFPNVDRYIYVYLSLLFNSFMYHGYLPPEFMKTAIVPIIKCKTGNTADKNNYRPIALVKHVLNFFNFVYCRLLRYTWIHIMISLALKNNTRQTCVYLH